nr:dynamin family protein [Lachnospiraceae bacterium]
MVKIKIISNPYQKEVRYQKWVEERNEWDEINYANNRNSRLLNTELTQGFFPFKAKKIVDIIIDEYGIPGEEIEIYFEGTADEYHELVDVCTGGEYEYQLKPVRAEVGLENARDILPEVKELFQEMSPLIMKSANQEKIERDLARFSDASSDVVPVCVLGNYSAGKSTFINALIGSETLKSGIEPVTAKIYKISRSKYSDRARVSCFCRGEEINLHFTEGHTRFDFEQDNNELAQLLLDALSGKDDESIVLRVKEALALINDYEDSDLSDEAVSDLIEVEMPFTKGVLAQSQHPFVIFDTPGSNSASNAKHL